jgi:hypothetical protein
MIFPHTQSFKGQVSEGFAICPYELIGGRIKWRVVLLKSPNSDPEDPAQREWRHYDKIHIDRADIIKFVRALAYIAGLVREGPGEKLQPPKKAELSEIEKRIMKFRL